MPKELAVGLSSTIYDAVLDKEQGIIANERTDRTDECIAAVAEHMRLKADYNKEQKGFWQYRWKGVGTMTWQSENLDSEG